MDKTTEQNQTQMMGRMIADEEYVIDLAEVFFLLLHRWKAIFLAMLVGAAVFGSYHVFLMNPAYQADAKIYITNTDSMISFSDLQLSAALTDDYANIIKSRTVLTRVIEELGLDLDYRKLSELVEVKNPDSTHIIQIIVTCDDVETSRNIANALLNISISQIYQVIGSSEPTIIDYAKATAVENVKPSIFKYFLIGGLLGAVLICAVEILNMLMNTTMKNEEDVEKYLNLPILAAVPYYNEKRAQGKE